MAYNGFSEEMFFSGSETEIPEQTQHHQLSLEMGRFNGRVYVKETSSSGESSEEELCPARKKVKSLTPRHSDNSVSKAKTQSKSARKENLSAAANAANARKRSPRFLPRVSVSDSIRKGKPGTK